MSVFYPFLKFHSFYKIIIIIIITTSYFFRMMMMSKESSLSLLRLPCPVCPCPPVVVLYYFYHSLRLPKDCVKCNFISLLSISISKYLNIYSSSSSSFFFFLLLSSSFLF